MNDVAAARIARAHADTTDLALADDWAVLSSVPCLYKGLPYPWATIGRVVALPAPPAGETVTAVVAWLRARSAHWSLLVRLADEPALVRLADETAFAGLRRWDLMPVLALSGGLPSDRPDPRPAPSVHIGPASGPEEFLIPYGAHHAPVVTGAHFASQRIHHLVARTDGEPVSCARVSMLGDTAYVGAVSVLPGWQGRGIGSALTLAASRLGGTYSDLIWLHASADSRGLYERLGYRHVDDHVLLVPAAAGRR
jgi:GNAT superfamily N-acetyltransferase